MRGRKRNPETEQAVRELAAAGLPRVAIAKRLGISPVTASRYIKALGLHVAWARGDRRPPNTARADQIRAWLAERPMTAAELAERLGITENSARSFCHRHAIRYAPQTSRAKSLAIAWKVRRTKLACRQAEAALLLAAGLKNGEVAKRIGVDVATIFRWKRVGALTLPVEERAA